MLYFPRFQDYVLINELGELVVLRIAIPESPRLPDKNADSWDSDLYPFQFHRCGAGIRDLKKTPAVTPVREIHTE